MKVFTIFSQTIKCSKILCCPINGFDRKMWQKCGSLLDLYANKVKRKGKMKGNFIIIKTTEERVKEKKKKMQKLFLMGKLESLGEKRNLF